MIKRSFALHVCCALFGSALLFCSEMPSPHTLQVHAILSFQSSSSVVDRILKIQSGFILVESSNHRLAFVDEKGNLTQQIGSIGQGAGELYYPGDLVQDKAKNFYVFETRNHRIQVFDSSGKSLRTFKVEPQPYGMAITSKGELLLGQPAKGKLISAYSADGHFLRSFGDLHKASDFYGPKLKSADKAMRESINRVLITCDDSDYIYVVFLGAPFWRKYSPDGRLLFEKKIDFPDAQRIIDELSNTLKAHATVKFDEDQTSLPYITTGITVDRSNHVLFSLRWDKSWIAEASTDGASGPAFSLLDQKLIVRNIIADTDQTIFALGANIGHYNEVYKIKIPASAQGSNKK
jgi:hypothetical protein